jgi:hypothetical protein
MMPAVRNGSRLVSGPSAIRAAEALRVEVEKRNDWPFDWVYPPPNSDRVTAIGNALSPLAGVGNQISVVSYTVPSGYQMCLAAVVLAYTGGAFGLADMNWTVDKNTPLGIPALQSSIVQGLASVPIPLGSISPMYSEFPLTRNEPFDAEDLIQAKVWVSANINGGLFSAILKGWIWPAIG